MQAGVCGGRSGHSGSTSIWRVVLATAVCIALPRRPRSCNGTGSDTGARTVAASDSFRINYGAGYAGAVGNVTNGAMLPRMRHAPGSGESTAPPPPPPSPRQTWCSSSSERSYPPPAISYRAELCGQVCWCECVAPFFTARVRARSERRCPTVQKLGWWLCGKGWSFLRQQCQWSIDRR